MDLLPSMLWGGMCLWLGVLYGRGTASTPQETPAPDPAPNPSPFRMPSFPVDDDDDDKPPERKKPGYLNQERGVPGGPFALCTVGPDETSEALMDALPQMIRDNLLIYPVVTIRLDCDHATRLAAYLERGLQAARRERNGQPTEGTK